MIRRLALAAVAATAAGLAVAAPAQAAIAPMSVTVDPVGTANPDGSATVTGTLTCPVGNVWYGYADVWQPTRANQNAYGRGTDGSIYHPIACTGAPQVWTVTTTSRNGTFVAGPADVRAVFATQGPAGLNTVASDAPTTLA